MPLFDARLSRIGELQDRIEKSTSFVPSEPSLPFPYPHSRTLDANGTLILFVLRCDTDTGMVERFDVRNGRWQLNDAGLPIVLREHHPAPLRIVPKSHNNELERS
jgi:hypothetical protein